MTRPHRALGVLLVAGTLLVDLAGLIHPMLHGGGAEQLAIIAGSARWRAVHLALLWGTALVMAGLVGEWLRHDGSGPELLVRGALGVVAIGLAVNGLDMAYMAGTGFELARLHAAGNPLAATLFDATHPFGRMEARFGNMLIGVGAALLGWGVWNARRDPRWVAALAWLAAAGLLGPLLAHESTPFVLAPVALLSGWQLAAGVRAIAAREP